MDMQIRILPNPKPRQIWSCDLCKSPLPQTLIWHSFWENWLKLLLGQPAIFRARGKRFLKQKFVYKKCFCQKTRHRVFLLELLPAKCKKQSPDPTKKDASREELWRRALAGGNMWDLLSCLLTLLESFDKNNSEMGMDSVARQMHQKTVQHYWVNILKQQVTGGGVPHLKTRQFSQWRRLWITPRFWHRHRHMHC